MQSFKAFEDSRERGNSLLDDRIIDETDETDELEAQEWNPNLASEIDYLIPFDCVAADIQKWILSVSIYPQPAIAFAAAMAVVGVTIGRNVAYENIKGNLMFIATAESGEGKDWPLKAAGLLLRSIDMGGDVYGKMASGAALLDALEMSPSMLFCIDEFGEYLNGINGKTASQYSKEISVNMTELYTSSSDMFMGKRTKGNEPKVVIEPNLCVLGLTTERQIFDGLKTSDLANGSLARYSLLFGLSGLLPVRINNRSLKVPDAIIERLLALKDKYSKAPFLASTQLTISDEYTEHKHDLVLRMKELSNSLEGDKRDFVPMYNRIAVRCIQQAMLIDQCQNIEVLDWFERLERESVGIFVKKFNHLGSDNDIEKSAKRIERVIKEGGKDGISNQEFNQKCRGVRPAERKQILKDLVDVGLVFSKKQAVKKSGGKRSQKDTTFYFWVK